MTTVWIAEDHAPDRKLAREACGDVFPQCAIEETDINWPKTVPATPPDIVILDLFDDKEDNDEDLFTGKEYYNNLRAWEKKTPGARPCFVVVFSHWLGEPKSYDWVRAQVDLDARFVVCPCKMKAELETALSDLKARLEQEEKDL